MKKLLLLSASVLLFTIAKTQDPHFGFKGGLNAGTLNKGGTTETPRISINAGAFAHIHTSPNWSLQPEILFSSEGGKSHLTGGNLQAKEILNYLNFPVLIQYMFNNGLRLEGGAQFGVLLSAKEKVNDNRREIKSLYQSTAVSIPLGASFLTKTGFGIDARYVFGLSNIYKDDSQTIQSNVFQLGIFYQLSDKWKK